MSEMASNNLIHLLEFSKPKPLTSGMGHTLSMAVDVVLKSEKYFMAISETRHILRFGISIVALNHSVGDLLNLRNGDLVEVASLSSHDTDESHNHDDTCFKIAAVTFKRDLNEHAAYITQSLLFNLTNIHSEYHHFNCFLQPKSKIRVSFSIGLGQLHCISYQISISKMGDELLIDITLICFLKHVFLVHTTLSTKQRHFKNNQYNKKSSFEKHSSAIVESNKLCRNCSYVFFL